MCSSNKFWQYASNSKLPGVGEETRTDTLVCFIHTPYSKELETLYCLCALVLSIKNNFVFC